jgi:hypothetical protein
VLVAAWRCDVLVVGVSVVRSRCVACVVVLQKRYSCQVLSVVLWLVACFAAGAARACSKQTLLLYCVCCEVGGRKHTTAMPQHRITLCSLAYREWLRGHGPPSHILAGALDLVWPSRGALILSYSITASAPKSAPKSAPNCSRWALVASRYVGMFPRQHT